MAGFSTALAQAIFKATLAKPADQASLTAPGSSIYVSLHKSAPSDQAGTDTSEISATVDDTAYVRVLVNGTGGLEFTGAEVSDGGTGYVYRATNSAAISFPAVVYGSGAAAYSVTHWGIWKHQTSTDRANLMYSGAFDTPRTMEAGDIANIGAGEMDIDLT